MVAGGARAHGVAGRLAGAGAEGERKKWGLAGAGAELRLSLAGKVCTFAAL